MSSLQRLHPHLDAYTVRFDDALLEEIRASYQRHLAALVDSPRHQYLFEGGRTHRAQLGDPGPYFVLSYEDYPLLWFSNDNEETYATFRRFFEALSLDDALRQRIDCRHRVVLYCGFLVIGDRAPAAQWHCDYVANANAFTLLTPLFELEPEHGHLLYRVGEQSHRYRYQSNEAILFSDQTPHSTEPYAPSPRKRILVSLTFGTDKLEYWPQLRQSLESQARYFVLPCGHVYGRCDCLKPSALERVSRWVQQRLAPVSQLNP